MNVEHVPVAAWHSPTAAFADVDILPELTFRPKRAPDYAREHDAFVRLTASLTANPRAVLQELAMVGVELCGADTAGVSLLDGEVFRWEAVAGVFSHARGGTMPRDQSPCGVCIDRNSTQLMHLADRCFPALLAEPRFVEAMLIQFHLNDKPLGTIWIVSHRHDKQFDGEDERIVRVLSRFASAGWQMWKATEALARESARKDEVVATLGHELRNPLGAISSAATVLRRKTAETSPALDIIARQVRHVTRLVDDLMDVAFVAAGKLTLEREPVDLRGVVEESIETILPQVLLRKHQLVVNVGKRAMIVDADALRIAQVVTNLVGNAAKYTPPHGRISVDLVAGMQHVTLEVRDNGIGIPADSLQAIFEPFVQLAADQHDAAGGLGLGLPLVRRIVDLHGGTASATSPGVLQGSCFTVQLPLYAATATLDEIDCDAPS